MPRFAAACLALALAGCAARGLSPQIVAELGKAQAMVREGCYSCLKDAQAIFERLSAPPRPVPGAARGAFDATLLIAMRGGGAIRAVRLQCGPGFRAHGTEAPGAGPRRDGHRSSAHEGKGRGTQGSDREDALDVEGDDDRAVIAGADFALHDG